MGVFLGQVNDRFMKKYKGLLIPELAEFFMEKINELSSEYKSKNINIDKILDDLAPDLIQKYEEEVTNIYVKKLAKNYKTHLNIAITNLKEISKENENVFKYFFAYISIASNVFNFLKKEIRNKELELKDRLIISLYGYLIRIADQIGIMLLNGYPDGALRLWRTFYENAIVTQLLIKIDTNELASKYIDFNIVNQKRKVESYMKHHEKLKFPILNDSLIERVNLQYEETKDKVGEHIQDELGWAADIFNKKVRLTNIESFVKMERYRPFYKYACEQSHSNFSGFLQFFEDDSNVLNIDTITLQRSDKKALIDPVQLTIGCFHEVNLNFIPKYSIKYEEDVNLSIFQKTINSLWEALG